MKSDHRLQTDVLAELGWEPSVVADHVGVSVQDGVVKLTGHVESQWQKHAAETAVGRVQGVEGLAEEIEVYLPPRFKRSDDEIAAAATERLAWDSSVP